MFEGHDELQSNLAEHCADAHLLEWAVDVLDDRLGQYSDPYVEVVVDISA